MICFIPLFFFFISLSYASKPDHIVEKCVEEDFLKKAEPFLSMFKPPRAVVHESVFDYLRKGLPVPKQLKVKAKTTNHNSIKQPAIIIPAVYPHNHCINTQNTFKPSRIIPVIQNNSSYFNIYSGHPKKIDRFISSIPDLEAFIYSLNRNSLSLVSDLLLIPSITSNNSLVTHTSSSAATVRIIFHYLLFQSSIFKLNNILINNRSFLDEIMAIHLNRTDPAKFWISLIFHQQSIVSVNHLKEILSDYFYSNLEFYNF